MHEHPDTKILMPPGTYLENLPHPDGQNTRNLEIAIFKEHRFAFYFWNRWHRGLDATGKPPSLVTIDWHRDLAPPSESEKAAFGKLDLDNQEEVARFVWSQLDTHNDSHLLSAAYLNLIGDIYLLKNYGYTQESTFTDSQSKSHHIFEFRSLSDFEKAVTSCQAERILLDIDLDFFIKQKIASHQLDEVTLYDDEKIEEILNNQSPLFKYLYPKLTGITIATEPRYCGGIQKSNHLLSTVLDCFFTRDMHWKHLQ